MDGRYVESGAVSLDVARLADTLGRVAAKNLRRRVEVARVR